MNRFRAIVFLTVISPACSGQNQPASTPRSVPIADDSSAGPAVVTGQAPLGAFVALEPVGRELPLPDGPAIMDQYSRQFIPDLMFVRVGQVVEFRNSEDVDHNIRVLRNPTGVTVMNESGSQNQVFKHTFEQPGSYDVSCDVHPGMRATIVASRTPYVTGTDNRGAFSLKDVPAGRYTIKVTANGRETSQEIQVLAPRTEVTLNRR